MQTLRRQGRGYALQLLYLAEIDATSDAEARERFWWKSRASKKARAFATELVETTLAHQERIDHTLAAALEHCSFLRQITVFFYFVKCTILCSIANV